MFTSTDQVSVRNEQPGEKGKTLPILELVRILRGNMRLSCAVSGHGFGAGPAPGRVVTADLIALLMSGTGRNANVGGRRYLLPPPSPG